MQGVYVRTRHLAPGITGTSAAFIDVAFILIMVLLFVVAALKTHTPERVKVDVAIPEQAQLAEDEPPMTINIFADGVVVNDGELLAFEQFGSALEQIEIGEGTLGLCVSADAAYHQFRNVVATVQSKFGPRKWADCGGRL